MMRPYVKRRPRTKSSIRACEEKFCCPLINCEAKFYCKDCKTAQCQACETNIHRSKLKFDFHSRHSLPTPPESSLCQANQLNLVCEEKNYPDLWCENCKVQICFTCFDTYHSSEKKRQHISVSFSHHLKKLQEIQQQKNIELHDSSELYQDAITDMIKPLSPCSLGDDSMTFYSYPQESEANKDNYNMAFTSSNTSIPDICQAAESSASDRTQKEPPVKSFLLVDDAEVLQVRDHDDFVDNLGCDREETFKVVSIYGNTGDGKSHTLNHTFFEGHETFKTCTSQSSCTLGVWCALDKKSKTIVLDTEGLLGSSSNENKRTRFLLKIFAISDVVIYRTKAERLHNDMYVFLSNASKAYCQHFAKELKNASEKLGTPASNLGPSLVVFQETHHTDVIQDEKGQSVNTILRDRFYHSENPVDAFSSIAYVGIKTQKFPTDFKSLKACVFKLLEDGDVRAARKPEIIFQSLKALNDKFSQPIETPNFNTFPDQYFTCTSRCQACNSRCQLSMNHDLDSEPHDPGKDKRCEYQSQLGNKVFMCKTCLRNRKEVIVVPKTSSSSDSSWMGLTKYIWSGYVYECSNCGVIFRSREHWYGNEEEEKALHVEFKHVWPQGPSSLDGTHNAAWKVLEGFNYVADTISSVGARPTKYLSEWTADQINPAYWVPNSEIIRCSNSKCGLTFDCAEQKHHCRACGKGFCSDCSSKKRPVPERGWGPESVRVCDECYSKKESGTTKEPTPDKKDLLSPADTSCEVGSDQAALTARKVGEAVSSTFSVMASALSYPKDMIKNSARPAYWVPDDKIESCCVCKNKFGPRLAIHHCRDCGQGVCEVCSPNKRNVPLRGWDYPVRVCKDCERRKERI